MCITDPAARQSLSTRQLHNLTVIQISSGRPFSPEKQRRQNALSSACILILWGEGGGGGGGGINPERRFLYFHNEQSKSGIPERQPAP